MITIILIYIFCIAGIFGHWAVRYVQGRTTSSIWVYLKSNFMYTYASFASGIASATAIVSVIMPDMTPHQLIVLFGAAYTAGYTGDSQFNKDAPTSESKQTKAIGKPKTIEIETNENDSLNSVLDDDSNL